MRSLIRCYLSLGTHIPMGNHGSMNLVAPLPERACLESKTRLQQRSEAGNFPSRFSNRLKRELNGVSEAYQADANLTPVS